MPRRAKVKESKEQAALFSQQERNIHHLEGAVERVFFSNERFSAGTLETKMETVRIRGKLPLLSPGMQLKGTWSLQVDQKWGEQYEAIDVYVEEDTDDLSGLEMFIRRNIKGIGKVAAANIIERFGEKSLEALEDPKMLQQVSGIGPSLAKLIPELWDEVKAEFMQLRALFKIGLPYYQAKLALEHFGSAAPSILEQNIYKLTEVSGIGFKFADRIALESGMERDDPRRLRAIAVFALVEALGDGHTIADYGMFVGYVTDKTDANVDEAQTGLTLALEEGDITESYREFYALPYVAKAEMYVIRRFKELALSKGNVELVPEDEALTEEQRSIFKLLGRNRLAVLTGGPGVGKTRTVSALVQAARSAMLRYALAAPTGKAARRISELSGEEASTIHRLLGWKPPGGFIHNEENPLTADLVIVDECSMVDVFLMRSLLRAIGPETTLLLVGDADQLPPVGPGQPFAHAKTNVVRLSVIFRQAQENPIIMGAHAINEQRPPAFPPGDSRLEFRSHEDPGELKSAMLGYYDALAKRYGEPPQVLSPMNIGPMGVVALNKVIKEHVNPGNGIPFDLPGNQEVHVGDILIQTKNDYEIGLMNGEQGTILSYNDDELILRTALGDLVLDKSQTKNLQLAYAITIHKAQGSEWKSCIMVCHTSHYIMLYKELFYTGLTRASESSMFIGRKQALFMALKRRMSERKSLMAFQEVWETQPA